MPIPEPPMHQHNPLLAVQMLDLLLEFFADDARWMRVIITMAATVAA